jgi:hypothetical protein
MKHLYMKLFLALGSICLGGTALQSQSYTIKADVPFAFHVNNTDLHAGIYRVERSASNPIEFLRDSRGVKTAVMSKGLWDNKGSLRLVFRCYGNEAFLAEIWGEGTGVKVPVSKLEREVRERPDAKEVATISVDATVAP